jgi:outer membrane immunogenic protein
MYRAPAVGGYKDAPYVTADWSGFYAGVNGGGGWGDSKDLIFTDTVPGTGNAGKFQLGGGFGGGQIGYNWQGIWHPHLVLGIEADIQGSGIDNKFSRVASYFGSTLFDAKQDIDFFGTVRGRVGYASDGFLIYGTGGFAYGGVRTRIHLTNAGFTNNLSRDEVETGFAAGGGIEYKFSPKWSAKVEYQFIDLGDQRLSNIASDGLTDRTKVDERLNTVRAGINYHFIPAYEPLK